MIYKTTYLFVKWVKLSDKPLFLLIKELRGFDKLTNVGCQIIIKLFDLNLIKISQV